MAKLLTGLVATIATLALMYAAASTLAAALTTTLTGRTRADFTTATEHASAMSRVARAECESLNGYEKDICVARTHGEEKHVQVDAQARYKGTAKSRDNARIASANADFMVAHLRCQAKSGSDRAQCLIAAKAGQKHAIADAPADARTLAGDAGHGAALPHCNEASANARPTCVPPSMATAKRTATTQLIAEHHTAGVAI
jgi:hyperosmotically inducible protein